MNEARPEDAGPSQQPQPGSEEPDSEAVIKALLAAQRANRMENRRRDDHRDATLTAEFIPAPGG